MTVYQHLQAPVVVLGDVRRRVLGWRARQSVGNILPDQNGTDMRPTRREPTARSKKAQEDIRNNAPTTRARSALRGALGDSAIGPLEEPGLDGLKWLPHLCEAMHSDLSRHSLKAYLYVRLRTVKVAPEGEEAESAFKKVLVPHRFDNVGHIPDRIARWKAQLDNALAERDDQDYSYVVKGIEELVLTWIR